MKKRLGIVSGALALIALAPAFTTSPSAHASAQSPTPARAAASHAGFSPNANLGPFLLKNANTGWCVDDSQAFGLRAIGCNGTFFQDWWIANVGGNHFRFQNVQTGACMVEVPGVGLGVTGCDPSAPGQTWDLFSGAVTTGVPDIWVNVINTGCLDDSAAFGLRTAVCNELSFQTWFL